MIDRSQFLEELRRNPELMHRIAVITAGEVGNAPIEKQMIQAETIFNRAIARGQSLEQVTRQVGAQPGGYYPSTTFNNGERIMGRGGAEAAFRERILKPVLAGSDVGREKLGFSPTGNASNDATNFASRRAAAGIYAKHAWYGDPRGGEMYVQEKTGLDRNERLDAQGPSPPRDVAAADLPPVPAGSNWRQQTGAPPPMTGGTRDIVAPVGGPGDPRRPPLYGPNAQSTAAARPGGLGGMLASMFGGGGAQVAPGRSSYIDPNTGHQIINPGGSGEQAMGLTRDIGRPSSSRQPSLSPFARPAPAPQRPAAAQPPGVPTAAPPPPAAPASPQPDNLGIDEAQRGLLAAPSPPPAVSSLTGAPNANALALAPAMFDVKPTEQQRPLGDFKPALSPFDTSRVEMPFDEFALQRERATAPPQAASLAVQKPEPPTPAWSPPPNAPAAFPVGGVKTPELPYAQPRTVDQQLGGLSPFGQWPPPWWDVGGGGFGGGFGGGGGFDFGAFG